MVKIIKFYRKNQWGNERLFVHPDNAKEFKSILSMTGKKTIDYSIIGAIATLSDGEIQFEEVIAPR